MNALQKKKVILQRLKRRTSFPLIKHEFKVLSQNGEDGVTLEIIRRIFGSDYKNKNFFEFGVESGNECNCAILANFLDWNGVFIESDENYFNQLFQKYANNNKITTIKEIVTANNIQSLIDKNMPEIDILSIDIDSHDYWVWEAITSKPKLVIIEYNPALTGKKVLSKERVGGWDKTTAYGASLDAYIDLASKKGYSLIHTDFNAVNAFFIRDDLKHLFPEPIFINRENKTKHRETQEDVFITIE